MRKRLIGWTVAVTAIALLLGAVAAGDASAWDRGRGGFHHHGFHGGRVFIGPRVFVGPRFFVGPRYYPYYAYPYPYYPYYDYAPPVVVTPPPPTDYVQREPQPGYWYYCQDPAGYYPTVAACPGGWVQVAPRTE
jgi:hypothetical protein